MTEKPRIRVKARTAPLSFEQWCIYEAKWISLQPIGFARSHYSKCDACNGTGCGFGDNGMCEECMGYGNVRELP